MTQNSTVKFYLLARGAVFECNGKRFKKTAMSMAQDDEGIGTVFAGQGEVEPIGEPVLLSDEEAARWKPSDIPWTSYMTPAPG
ncbi:MAG TPA: hypothetical protein VKY92_09875 [Verrucomicrobiae bacterium]|nr:hypothetical protein [Verrucomicrobiae bacterium]